MKAKLLRVVDALLKIETELGQPALSNDDRFTASEWLREIETNVQRMKNLI